MRCVVNAGRHPLSVAVIAALSLSPFSPVMAYSFDNGAVEGNIDTTLSFGTTTRLHQADRELYCTANGGTSFGCNSDDGNLNYATEVISQVHKFTTDLEINHKSKDIGAFLRVKGFVDHKNNSADSTGRTQLSNKAIDLVGENLDVLDAYVWSAFDINGQPAEIRFGKHVLNWGESTFIQGGINAINPIDASAIRLPGAELREALLPVNMFSMSWSANDTTTIEGFYQFDWDKTIPDPSGSFFSVNDFATDGGVKVQLGFGDIADSFGFASHALNAAGVGLAIQADTGGAITNAALNADENFLSVPRGDDNAAKDSGQWGLALRYFAEDLNDTEFGFYYMNYHSRLPLISARTGTQAAVNEAGLRAGQIIGGAAVPAALRPTVANLLAQDIYTASANYIIEYPEDIQLIGLSFNTNAGGWAVQGEYSHKKDVPLQIDDVELLLAALTPLSGLNAAVLQNQVTNGAAIGVEQYIRGYIERDVSQLQATATRVFSNVMGANEFVFVAEAAVTHVHNMPSKSTLRLNGPGTYTSGNTFHAGATGTHSGKAAEDADHFADATSWGYRLAGRWTYNNAFKSINLLPRFALQHDVSGITPGPGGNFVEGRKALTLGMTATYKNQWSADMAFTGFWGAGRHNLLSDRDFMSFNIKYSF